LKSIVFEKWKMAYLFENMELVVMEIKYDVLDRKIT
jgi:hypothetical protein